MTQFDSVARRHVSTRGTRACLAACLALLHGVTAWADEAPPWHLAADYAVQHDSNLYRVGDGQTLPGGASRADTVHVLGVEGEVDKRLGRQHLHANLRLAHNRYAANEGLNANSSVAGIALDWETMGNLSGRLSASDERQQYKFNGLDSIASASMGRNIVDTRTLLAAARLGAATRLGLDARLEHRGVSYSATAFNYREFSQNSASLGLSYRRPGRFSLGLLARATDGRYPKYRQLGDGSFQDDRFRRDDIELSGSWDFTPANRVQWAVGPSRISYDRDNSRDSSAVTGHFGWDLEASGKLGLRLEGGRDFGQSSRAVDVASTGGYVDYSRTTSYLRLSAREQLTGKLSLQASAGTTRRELANTLGLSGGGTASATRVGHDDTRALSLGLRWTPLRELQLGCDVGRERRTADQVLSTSMASNTLGCSVRLGVS